MVVYSYVFEPIGRGFDSRLLHMTNTVHVREGLDINRIKEEYEFLGYQVKRQGRDLLLSMKGTKNRDKKRSDKDSDRGKNNGSRTSDESRESERGSRQRDSRRTPVRS